MTNIDEFKTQGKEGEKSTSSSLENTNTRKDNPDRAYKVLVADLVGMKFDQNGNPDFSELREYIEEKNGVFHEGPIDEGSPLEKGKIHFKPRAKRYTFSFY